MSDNETKAEGQEAPQAQKANFAPQRIYVKDISFESPNSPVVFQKEWKPEVKMDLQTRNSDLGDGHFEVVVSVTLTVSVEGMTAYIAEVQQAGIFKAEGLESTRLAQAINAFGPNFLFPYLREAVDSVLTKGSFPSLMLAPVNFDALFAQAVMKQQQEQAAAQADETTTH
mgnify:CR=1 FL=1